MKIPLDYLCVRSGLLCNRCQSLVDSGQVDQFEVKVMEALLDLEETQFRELKDATYYKAIRSGNLLILLVESPPSIDSSKWIKIARALQDKLKLKVRILEKTTSIKNSAVQLLSPARVLGVNTVWLPDGSVQYVIRVAKNEKRLLPANAVDLENALSKIHDTKVKIRVE
ncbi:MULTISPECIES: transcription elongation factor NusA [Metallosphaera]|uniref:Transcription elongation factor-like protein n=3 Tax=Metallosphaera TaxID=41980 RepID=A4YD79_METS5|nr:MULTISPECIES: transcription elongation factor NusA [Metallosphaera]ABP94381.1 Transcription elongation factor-like protein [Metallosphaera sedula DSM 5348]AIM26368.1 Transcription elongation factor-like protein [Metallosphaera sedula]AKV73376.1 transcription elongation factor NusA [Metallosphaera sedula]AKV75620.1 transcription elongation factor NusA [Metallosphaera sedula]AKV77866.1 transcription elongation factor NusA [Metallosphaera sedula]